MQGVFSWKMWGAKGNILIFIGWEKIYVLSALTMRFNNLRRVINVPIHDGDSSKKY